MKPFTNDIKSYNVNVREDLIQELDNNITGFRDIKWRSVSKRFRNERSVKTIKYELAILITDCYWGHELRHNKDERYYSLYYEKLKSKLGKDYKKHIDTVFDVKHGVSISSFRKKDGSTSRYKLKPEVVEICDNIFRKNIKRHSIVDRDGKVMTKWVDYAVSSVNEKGEYQKKIDNKKYIKISPSVLLNKNNGTLLTHLFSDLYKYKTGRLSRGKVQKWIDIIESIGGDIEDGRRWSGERLIELHNSSLEIYNKMMLDITGDGSVGQTYKERNTGRLYAEGFGSLQGMMREQRRILMGGLGYYEYDMENAHYTILQQYYKMLSNKKLPRITKYISNTKGYRLRLEKETGNDYEVVKQVLISLIYGSGITHRHITIDGVSDMSGIYRTVSKQSKNKDEVEELWSKLVNHPIVLDLHTEVDTAYKMIKESWVTSRYRKNIIMKNMRKKTTSIYVDGGDTGRMKSKGMLLSHFLQGIESSILFGIIREEGYSFVMPHHDGWVSKMNWDTDRLSKLISLDTRKLLLDYNGIRGSFDIKIKKVELTDIIVGDWTEKILSKGVVDTIV